MNSRGRDPRIFKNFFITCTPCGQAENSLGDMRVHINSECLYADSPQLFCGCCAQTFPSFAHLANRLNAPGTHNRPAITIPTLTLPTSPTMATTIDTQTLAQINTLTSAPHTLPTQLLASPQASPLPTLSLSQTQLVDEILTAHFDSNSRPPTPAQRPSTPPTQTTTPPSLASPQTIPDSHLTLSSHHPPPTTTSITTHTDTTPLLSRLIQENVNLRQTTQTLANHSWWLARMLHEQLTTGATPTDATHRQYIAYTPVWLPDGTTSLTTPLPELLESLLPIYLLRISDPLLEHQQP